MIFPIVLPDPPLAPKPEGRLTIAIGDRQLLSMPYTDVHSALQALQLDGWAANWTAGQAVLLALGEAERVACRDDCQEKPS